MLPSIFEKQEICSNRAKSLLIFNIIQYYQQKKKEDHAMERRFVI